MKKTFIIDGSNVVRTLLHMNKKMNFTKEKKFSKIFLDLLGKFNNQENYNLEVYFDGPKRDINPEQDLINILFSNNKSADDMIVNSVYDIIKNYNGDVCVITEDQNLIKRCREYGAQTWRAWSFFNSVKKAALQYT